MRHLSCLWYFRHVSLSLTYSEQEYSCRQCLSQMVLMWHIGVVAFDIITMTAGSKINKIGQLIITETLYGRRYSRLLMVSANWCSIAWTRATSCSKRDRSLNGRPSRAATSVSSPQILSLSLSLPLLCSTYKSSLGLLLCFVCWENVACWFVGFVVKYRFGTNVHRWHTFGSEFI